MRNYGKYLVNLSGVETPMKPAMDYVLLVMHENFGGKWTAVMELEGNTRRPNMMKGTITFNAKGVTDLKEVSRRYTKKKLKKGMAKEPGISSSSKAGKSAKGVKSKLK